MNTKFLLFTRSNKEDPQYIDDNDEEKLKNSNHDITKRTIIISHGWTGMTVLFL